LCQLLSTKEIKGFFEIWGGSFRFLFPKLNSFDFFYFKLLNLQLISSNS
jgi:hypothetical protein